MFEGLKLHYPALAPVASYGQTQPMLSIFYIALTCRNSQAHRVSMTNC